MPCPATPSFPGRVCRVCSCWQSISLRLNQFICHVTYTQRLPLSPAQPTLFTVSLCCVYVMLRIRNMQSNTHIAGKCFAPCVYVIFNESCVLHRFFTLDAATAPAHPCVCVIYKEFQIYYCRAAYWVILWSVECARIALQLHFKVKFHS